MDRVAAVIIMRGLGRQVSALPNWGKHRILTYPLRPVDFWYLLGNCGAEKEPSLWFAGMMTEGDDMGMGNVAEPRLMVGGDYRKTLLFEDLDRFVGRLCEGPISEEDLLSATRMRRICLTTRTKGRESRLAEYSEEGYSSSVRRRALAVGHAGCDWSGRGAVDRNRSMRSAPNSQATCSTVR